VEILGDEYSAFQINVLIMHGQTAEAAAAAWLNDGLAVQYVDCGFVLDYD
jgi:hypothetical protein